ncbi:MAG: hypothetical protein KF770_07600, partial [Anaerolineae bacterium]|nr:hypothetical protein [Anaerolineae bacterium]
MTDKDLAPDEPTESEEPQVFAVSRAGNGVQFSRRNFIELAAASAAIVTVTGCGSGSADATPRRVEIEVTATP